MFWNKDRNTLTSNSTWYDDAITAGCYSAAAHRLHASIIQASRLCDRPRLLDLPVQNWNSASRAGLKRERVGFPSILCILSPSSHIMDPPQPQQGDLNWRLSAHPITLICFLAFRIGALLMYLFGVLFIKDLYVSLWYIPS